jgi:hypothetical protein
MWRRHEKLLRSLDWDLQARFEHVGEAEFQGEAYLDIFFGILDVLAGEKESSEKRRIIRRALYEGARKPEESLAQYSLRRESEFTQADRFVQLPNDMKGFMLEEQSGLSKQGLQNLRALTGGSSGFDVVKKALRAIDTEEESMCRPKGSNYFLEHQEVPAETFDAQPYEAPVEEDILDSEAGDEVFYVISHMDLEEEDALSFLADWQKKKKTWGENKELKNALRKDRRHFEDVGSRAQRDPAAPNRRKKNIAELKRITRCANCGEKGHWRAECQQPYKPKSDKSKSFTAFAYLGSGALGPSHLAMNFFNGAGASEMSYMTIPAGHAIIDPGAAQDLIGETAFLALKKRLAEVHLRPVILKEPPPQAAGIGGTPRRCTVPSHRCSWARFPEL